jgi:U3 small nucleolar RNA-associated protein 14
MENISDNQIEEVLPYQYEPEPDIQTSNSGDESESEAESESSDGDEDDHAFEGENAWRLQSLAWCKCGNCTLKPKAIESFCRHEKALEYDEYDALLNEAETQGEKYLTAHADFKTNMLSEGVLKIDVCRYLEDNWPLDDEDLGKIHKL